MERISNSQLEILINFGIKQLDISRAMSALQELKERRAAEMQSISQSTGKAQERYRIDPKFNNLVSALEKMISEYKFTPTEVREAAMLACFIEEERRQPPPHPVFENVFIDYSERVKKMVCKCARYDCEDGRFQCSVTGDGCIFLVPNEKACAAICAAIYGEGPDAKSAEPQENEVKK